jgi:hypothetical protein
MHVLLLLSMLLGPRPAVIGAPASGQELLDRTLALVGGQAITLSDARAAVALGLVAADAAADPMPGVTNRLVDRELILREVQRYAPPAPSESAVEARLAEIRTALGSAAAVSRVLDQYGFSEARLRAWVRDDLRTQAYLQQRFASASTIRDRNELVADWVEELRRRTDVVILPQ